MNQQIWSGLTTATLMITSLSTASVGYAEQPQVKDDAPGVNVSLEAHQNIPEQVAAVATEATSEDAVKVGEYQSQDEPEETQLIAMIQPHTLEERQAATLYVRDIPVLTFLGSPVATSTSSSSSTASNSSSSSASTSSLSVGIDVKVATVEDPAPTAVSAAQSTTTVAPESEDEYAADPVWRATSIAARLNQLYRSRVNAEAITVIWDVDRQDYIIKVDGDELVTINSDTILPDTTSDLAIDALQVTNRLRRQMGNAPPLDDIPGRPQEPESQQISLGPIRLNVRGIASWYGPGFHGNRSASGEVFNQNALTAAHRSLPFGTQVRVTNLRNGRSVVVRINDRGPYSGHRVIDLSAAAARAVGLMQMGVAPVSIDVLGTVGAIASQP
jgi:rare lipoprotein A